MKWQRILIPTLAAALLCGCAPQTPPPEEFSPPNAIQVEVDWSKLEEKPAPQPDLDAGRWFDTSVEKLIPRTDYGPLYSYVGTTVTRTEIWTDESGTEHTWTDPFGSPVYGLMTRDGKVVTDPIYQGVYQPLYRFENQVTALPVLLLGRAELQWGDEPGHGTRYAVAAHDGSWCTDFEFWAYGLRGGSLLLAGPDGVTRLDCDTEPTRSWFWSWEELEIHTVDLPEVMETIQYLYGFQWTESGAFLGLTDPDDWENSRIRLLDPYTGELRYCSRQQWDEILNNHIQTDWNDRDEWIFDLSDSGVTLSQGEVNYQLPVPPGINTLHSVEINGDLAILRDYSSNGDYWLYHLPTGAMLTHQDMYIGFLQDAVDPTAPACVWVNAGQEGHMIYSPDYTLIASFPEDTGMISTFFTVQDGLLFARDDCTFFACHDILTGEQIFYRNLDLGD